MTTTTTTHKSQMMMKKEFYAISLVPSYSALATAVAPNPTNAPTRASDPSICAASCAGEVDAILILSSPLCLLIVLLVVKGRAASFSLSLKCFVTRDY